MGKEIGKLLQKKITHRGFFSRLFLLLGIESDALSSWGFRLRWWFFILVAGVLALSCFTGLLVYSTSPSFCRSCHIMEPYYQAWAKSKHKNVACVDCHYPETDSQTLVWKKFQALSQVAKFVTRTYSSKPYAEIEDSSCLRSECHATRLLRGKITTKKGIHFDHKPHLEGVRHGRQLKCVSCHSQVVVGEHIEVTYDSCYLCHLKGHKKGRNIEPVGGCLGCHSMPDKEIKVANITYNHKDFLEKHNVSCQSCHQDVLSGEGKVPVDRCITCHNEQEKLSRFNEIDFIHANHVTKHNTACFHCHESIKHGKTLAGTKELTIDCGSCHQQMHNVQRDFYKGLGARGVLPMPSPMYLSNVDCVGCHLTEESSDTPGSGETYTGSEKGCIDCHGKEYKGVLSEAHSAIQDTLLKIEEKLASISSFIPTKTASQAMEIAEIDHNLKLVKAAHSVHNIYYASQILRSAEGKLSALATEFQIKVEDTSELPVISGSFCATLCHSKLGVKVPPDVVHHKGKEMPHLQHIDMGQECTDCHEFGTHKEIRLKMPVICSQCHDDK